MRGRILRGGSRRASRPFARRPGARARARSHRAERIPRHGLEHRRLHDPGRPIQVRVLREVPAAAVRPGERSGRDQRPGRPRRHGGNARDLPNQTVRHARSGRRRRPSQGAAGRVAGRQRRTRCRDRARRSRLHARAGRRRHISLNDEPMGIQMPRRLHPALAAVIAIAAMVHAGHADAEAWPSKPIHLIVGYPAGGGLDFVTRAVAQRLSEGLGQQVIVENRSGASGSIGADYVARAAADGYTLFMASPAEIVVGPAAGQKIPYNPETDLLPVALAGETPLVIVINPAVPAKDLAEFIAYAKANPGKLNYGTPGTGSSMQFAGEAFNAGVGTQIQHVPYRGAAPALADALGNQVPMAIVGMPPTLGAVKAGKLRVIAVTSQKRSNVMPDVPAVAELKGMGDYRFTNWMGVFAPAKTPAAIVERLGAEIAKMVQEPATRKLLLDNGVEPQGMRGADPLDDRGRRLRRREDAHPVREPVVAHALELGHGRHVGHDVRALLRCHGDRPQLARLHGAERRRHADDGHRHLVAERVGQGRCGAVKAGKLRV